MANFVGEALAYRDYGNDINTRIFGIHKGTVSVDPDSLATGVSGEKAVTINGLAIGDIVLFSPPASLESGLVADGLSRVSAANTAQLRLTNGSAGTINGTARTWDYIWFDLTDPASA